jgi:hypothetical protein
MKQAPWDFSAISAILALTHFYQTKINCLLMKDSRGRWGIMAPRGITEQLEKTMKEVLPSAGPLLNYSVQQPCTLHDIAESEVQHTQTETRSKYFYPSDLRQDHFWMEGFSLN